MAAAQILNAALPMVGRQRRYFERGEAEQQSQSEGTTRDERDIREIRELVNKHTKQIGWLKGVVYTISGLASVAVAGIIWMLRALPASVVEQITTLIETLLAGT